jgi:cytochrome c
MSMMKRSVVLLFVLMSIVIVGKSACADSLGRTDYLADCSRCHGVDGKGGVPQMRAVPGYRSVDLTRLTESNGGQFPRQEVYDAIDGRKRFPAHFIGDMPTWGLKYQPDNRAPESEEKVRRRISALVGYVESLQPKRTEK